MRYWAPFAPGRKHCPSRGIKGGRQAFCLMAGLLVAGASLGPGTPIRGDDADSQRVQQLIDHLGHASYFVREQAERELARLGLAAFDALCAAQSSSNLEIASRARYLVQSQRVNLLLPDDPAPIRELLKDYATAELDVRAQKISALAQWPDGAGVPILCRLARYEGAETISKLAAASVLRQPHPEEINWSELKPGLQKILGESPRPAVQWLRAYLRWQTAAVASDRQAVAADWNKLVAAEAHALQTSPANSNREILTSLLRLQAQFLVQLDRHEAARSAVAQVVAHDPGTPESVALLIRWLMEQKLWSGLDGLERRFAAAFAEDSLLWFELAEARYQQGQVELAQEHAAHGRQYSSDDLNAHFRMALALRARGLMRWCEAEIRACLKDAPKTDTYAIFTRTVFSEILHDRGDNREAAEMLRLALEGMEENDKNNRSEENPFSEQAKERRIKEIKSRMHYFLAMQFKESDLAKHEQHLEQAVAIDPADADSLIALYRLPNASDARMERTRKLIREAVATFREEIRKENAGPSPTPTPFNQLAWLVSNTEGDFQEAIAMSKRSLELRPNTAAYLDTLGRCYYAVGDYANAVRHQAMAVAREPWSQQMQRQLQLFRKAQQEAMRAQRGS